MASQKKTTSTATGGKGGKKSTATAQQNKGKTTAAKKGKTRAETTPAQPKPKATGKGRPDGRKITDNEKLNAMRAVQERKEQTRRIYIGVACMLVAVFGIFGYFNTEAFLLSWFRTLSCGLFGVGFYLLPPALILVGVLLFRIRGNSRRKKAYHRRIVCALLLPPVVGGLYQLLLQTPELPDNLLQSSALMWQTGILLESGGAISGQLSLQLEAAISRPGTVIVLLLALTLLILNACGSSLAKVILLFMDWLAERRRAREEERRYREEHPEEFDEDDIDIDEDEEVIPYTPPVRKKQPAKRRVDSENRELQDVPVIEQLKIEETYDEPSAPEVPSAPEQGYDPEEDWSSLLDDTGFASPSEWVEEDAEEITLLLDFNLSLGGVAQAPEDELTEDFPPFPTLEEAMPPEPFEEAPPPKPKKKRRKPPAEPPMDLQPVPMAAVIPEFSDGEYHFPPIDLLQMPGAASDEGVGTEMAETQIILKETIESFGITPNITGYTRGPSVARFELVLERGVKLSKLTNLSDDIALALGVSGVRIAAVPDKPSTVGIEVPNKSVNAVPIRTVIDSANFRKSKSAVSFALGMDIAGTCVVSDISRMPHLLIAGTTGSGKSVCINSLLTSLLYKAKPDEVKLLMVDPKQVELQVYNGIPHLLQPVVTEAKKAAGTLQWAVLEMTRRYADIAEVGARKIDEYNRLAESDPEREKLPYIVIVIDELADLMMVAGKEVEESICRIAQLGRAAGMHLVVATQRPSADVITGLMKANIPSRIAFSVASAVESRIILDATGAEKLVGRGDMLYHPIGSNKSQRIQGCLIGDEEVESVVNYVKQNVVGQVIYDGEMEEQIKRNALSIGEKSGKGKDRPQDGEESLSPLGDYDEKLPEAMDIFLEIGMASTSHLQRKLKLGHARAGRVMDQLEELGLIGPFEGSKPRTLLLSKEEWAVRRRELCGDLSEQQRMAEMNDEAMKGDLVELGYDELPFDEE